MQRRIFYLEDLEERTIYNILSKPIPRFAYLLGKLVGIIGLLFLFTLLMSGVFCLVLWLREHAVLSETRTLLADAPIEELAPALKAITDATFNSSLVPGILIIFVKSALLASLTLLISSFATSSLFTIMIAAAIYFIGHLQSTARDYWLQGIASNWWTRISARPNRSSLPRPSILQSRGRRYCRSADSSKHFSWHFRHGMGLRGCLLRGGRVHLFGT